MNDKIVIEGIPPYDGEHEIDFSYFTNRELNIIKRLAGVRSGELDEALAAGDNDLVVALAVIALRRNGKQVVEDVIWDAPTGRIDLVVAPREDDDADVPPPSAPPSDESSGASRTPSGPDSEPAGDATQETSLLSTGPQV